ncbi:winged helix-turn-helix transcriptional regulator [Longispora sp. NPDC051575]|uniref:winged helix-turn-helix transcriptional regulator n=1 Tax=Longispora sp. NPDC051575 TaxID=3154943 RepID=UPI00343E219D
MAEFRDFDDVFALCGRRCTLEILTALEGGDARYTDLLNGIAPYPHGRTFGDALRVLITDGYIRHRVDECGSYYTLTEVGSAFMTVLHDFLLHLRQWRNLRDDGFLAA